MVKFLVADDHAIIRSGLKLIIQNHFSKCIVEEASDAEVTLDKIKTADYNLIILDVCLPDTDCPGLVKEILSIRPSANILVSSMTNEELYAKRYLQLGAMGYLSKSSSEKEIERAVSSILDNKSYVSAALLESITRETFPEKFLNPFERLSKGEQQILQYLMQGKSEVEISCFLDVEVSAVLHYKERILKKLNCTTISAITPLANSYHFSIIS